MLHGELCSLVIQIHFIYAFTHEYQLQKSSAHYELTRIVDTVHFDAGDTKEFFSNWPAPFNCGPVQVRLSLIILS